MDADYQPKSEDGTTEPIDMKQAMIKNQSTYLNQLLQELETGVNEEQHALLTTFFAERAVLNAMRVRITTDKQISIEKE